MGKTRGHGKRSKRASLPRGWGGQDLFGMLLQERQRNMQHDSSSSGSFSESESSHHRIFPLRAGLGGIE